MASFFDNPDVREWKYVKFRSMIQDILGNEFYKRHDSDKLADRTIFYCISIPGENDWVRNSPLESKNDFMINNSTSDHAPHNDNRDSEREKKNDRLSFKLVNWSYPIPSDGKNRCCLIKVYDPNLADTLRVNDIVQVEGLYESDANNYPDENSENRACQDHLDNEFEPANDFPHRLVPRVHVKTLKKLNHINPLLPEVIKRDSIDITTAKMARARLSTILTQLFAGDELAAEYLILSLISKIYRRQDVSSLGQFTVGISGFKPEMKFLIEKLYEIIAKITTHSHYIEMSIANLNNLRFTPKKDHDNNKMIAGTLQLPDGLFLMLDETALGEGLLTKQGTENLNSLNQMIQMQRHKYDFKFHSVEIDTDLKVLVVSEGKSILNVPYNLRIERNDPETIESMRQACESVNDFLNEEVLNMFRYFITASKDVPEYTIPNEITEEIQNDFVRWRQETDGSGKKLFSADDLSSYMTIARYLTISRGQTVLTSEIWKETCQLETGRTARLQTSR